MATSASSRPAPGFGGSSKPLSSLPSKRVVPINTKSQEKKKNDSQHPTATAAAPPFSFLSQIPMANQVATTTPPPKDSSSASRLSSLPAPGYPELAMNGYRPPQEVKTTTTTTTEEANKSSSSSSAILYTDLARQWAALNKEVNEQQQQQPLAPPVEAALATPAEPLVDESKEVDDEETKAAAAALEMADLAKEWAELHKETTHHDGTVATNLAAAVETVDSNKNTVHDDKDAKNEETTTTTTVTSAEDLAAEWAQLHKETNDAASTASTTSVTTTPSFDTALPATASVTPLPMMGMQSSSSSSSSDVSTTTAAAKADTPATDLPSAVDLAKEWAARNQEQQRVDPSANMPSSTVEFDNVESNNDIQKDAVEGVPEKEAEQVVLQESSSSPVSSPPELLVRNESQEEQEDGAVDDNGMLLMDKLVLAPEEDQIDVAEETETKATTTDLEHTMVMQALEVEPILDIQITPFVELAATPQQQEADEPVAGEIDDLVPETMRVDQEEQAIEDKDMELLAPDDDDDDKDVDVMDLAAASEAKDETDQDKDDADNAIQSSRLRQVLERQWRLGQQQHKEKALFFSRQDLEAKAAAVQLALLAKAQEEEETKEHEEAATTTLGLDDDDGDGNDTDTDLAPLKEEREEQVASTLMESTVTMEEPQDALEKEEATEELVVAAEKDLKDCEGDNKQEDIVDLVEEEESLTEVTGPALASDDVVVAQEEEEDQQKMTEIDMVDAENNGEDMDLVQPEESEILAAAEEDENVSHNVLASVVQDEDKEDSDPSAFIVPTGQQASRILSTNNTDDCFQSASAFIIPSSHDDSKVPVVAAINLDKNDDPREQKPTGMVLQEEQDKKDDSDEGKEVAVSQVQEEVEKPVLQQLEDTCEGDKQEDTAGATVLKVEEQQEQDDLPAKEPVADADTFEESLSAVEWQAVDPLLMFLDQIPVSEPPEQKKDSVAGARLQDETKDIEPTAGSDKSRPPSEEAPVTIFKQPQPPSTKPRMDQIRLPIVPTMNTTIVPTEEDVQELVATIGATIASEHKKNQEESRALAMSTSAFLMQNNTGFGTLEQTKMQSRFRDFANPFKSEEKAAEGSVLVEEKLDLLEPSFDNMFKQSETDKQEEEKISLNAVEEKPKVAFFAADSPATVVEPVPETQTEEDTAVRFGSFRSLRLRNVLERQFRLAEERIESFFPRQVLREKAAAAAKMAALAERLRAIEQQEEEEEQAAAAATEQSSSLSHVAGDQHDNDGQGLGIGGLAAIAAVALAGLGFLGSSSPSHALELPVTAASQGGPNAPIVLTGGDEADQLDKADVTSASIAPGLINDQSIKAWKTTRP